jgi:hypothetical protein
MLTNPLGLFALLGIPAVLALHYLQRKAVELPVSTLFLLERTQREAASGRRFDRLIPSIPLWMQLLAVLLLTWFLVEPRYPKSGTVQRLAIVLDSSASMTVFKDEAIRKLTESLPTIQGKAETLEITVLESVPTRPRLYVGTSAEDLGKALTGWTPHDGLTDPAASIRIARSLVSTRGTVVYFTDTPQPSLPFDARQISVGKPTDNMGFTGVTFSEQEGALVWRALVRNYGTTESTRTWSLVSDKGSTEPRSVTIPAGGLASVQAAFPKNENHVRLVLSPDAFTLDDTLPLVAPNPKPLALFAGTSPAFENLSKKLLHSLDHAIPTNDAASADLAIASYDPLDPVLPSGNSIVFVEDPTSAGAYLRGGIVAEPHPLLDGINWQALLVRETIELDRLPTDQVLLWQSKRPLIFLRDVAATESHPAAKQLYFNFDLRLSNAAQQPAFIVLLHRFAESIRSTKVAHVSANLEVNQPVELAAAPEVPLTITHADITGKEIGATRISSLKIAPSSPGFITVTQGDTPLLTAAVQFADTREADFSACAPINDLGSTTAAVKERHTRPDPYWQLWLLILIAALLASWKFTKTKTSSSSSSLITDH